MDKFNYIKIKTLLIKRYYKENERASHKLEEIYNSYCELYLEYT